MIVSYKSIIISSLLILGSNSSPLLGLNNGNAQNSNLSPKATANQLFNSIPLIGPSVSNVLGSFTPVLDAGPVVGTLLNTLVIGSSRYS